MQTGNSSRLHVYLYIHHKQRVLRYRFVLCRYRHNGSRGSRHMQRPKLLQEQEVEIISPLSHCIRVSCCELNNCELACIEGIR